MPRGPHKRREKFVLTDDVPVGDFAQAWFEILASPGIAKDVKALADQEGISVDALMCETVADGYHKRGKPLPPSLRAYIAKHLDMPDDRRRQLLARDLN